MSAPAYESYKDSGVEWLGHVPSHWEINRLKMSISTCKGGIWGDEANNGEDDIICIRVADFSRLDFRITLAAPTYRNIASKDRHGRILKRGDLLIEKSGGGEKQPVGAVALYDHDVPAVCSNFVARLELMPNMHPAYWTYVHAAAYDRALTARCLNQTSGIQNLDLTRYLDESAPFPPLSEQTAIAAFLDRETGKIDALIEAQTRLIELLKEKRQAVISHAVTKGLNPGAPMKDSGIEWLGQVPAHWEVAALKRFITILSGYAFPSAGFTTDESDVRLLRGANIGIGCIRWDDVVYWPEVQGLEEFSLAPGDIVLGMDRPWISGGLRISKLQEGDCPSLLLQRVTRLKPTPELDPDYLYSLLVGEAFYHHCAPDMTGVSVPHISPSQVEDFRVPIPPESEQREIASFITRKSSQYNELIGHAQSAIKHLQERRAALISAAVTGKIDVRGLVTIESEAA